MAFKTVKATATVRDSFKIDCVAGGHAVVIDQPVAAGGGNAGPSPLDLFFASLAGCIGTIARIAAMQQRINLRGMEIAVEGDINTDGLLGKPSDDPVGFKEIRVHASIDADMTREEKETFLQQIEMRCPVACNLIEATPVRAFVDEV